MKDFMYDNQYASDYQLMICSFEKSSGATTVDMGSQFENNQIKIVGTDEFVNINNDYSTPSPFLFQVCKITNDYTADEITSYEFSNINRWLNRKESHRFKIDKDNYEDIYFVGRFNIKAIKINNIIYGLELTFVSDFPYGFSDEITETFTGKDFSVYNYSDEIGILLPTIKITCKEEGDLIIRNSMDNEIFKLTECKNGENIIIDSKNMIIQSSDLSHKVYDCFNYNYIKLCNTYTERENKFNSTLNIDMEIKYSPVRKVGI